jgi:cbb3-type cytochrome oxidase maturation protein
MSIIFLLIPLSIVFAVAFLFAFIWSVRSGQYEDTTTPSMRLLLDDRSERPASRGGSIQSYIQRRDAEDAEERKDSTQRPSTQGQADAAPSLCEPPRSLRLSVQPASAYFHRTPPNSK